ncbi:MAG: GNAT family N-acetyltransferase [Actinomycetota bacterium]
MITLRPITDDNRAAVEALRIHPWQERFVNTVADAFLEAEAEPGGRAIRSGLYDDDTPVGFVMISDDVDGPDYIAHYLWKLLIDRDRQRRGYGTAALDLVSTYFRDRGNTEMWTTAGEGDGSPIPFYERYGFVRTGDIVFDDEVLLRLDLTLNWA